MLVATQSPLCLSKSAKIWPALRLPVLVIALAWAIGLAPGMWRTALAQEVTIAEATVTEATANRQGFGIEYAVPGGPRYIAPQGPGQIWFTASEGDGIGLVTVLSDPGEAQIRYRLVFYGLAFGSEPYDIAVRNGIVWFTLRGANALGRMDAATRELTLFELPAPNSRPTGLDIAPSGELWIVAGNGSLLRFDPDEESFAEYPFPDRMLSLPRGETIRYQNERNIWFTLPDANSVGNYNSVTDNFLSIPTGQPAPTGMALDAAGRIWVTALGSGLVGRYTPTTNSLWVWYDTPPAHLGAVQPADLIVFDENGQRQIWFSQSGDGSVGRLQLIEGTLLTRLRVPIGTAPSRPWGIQRAQNGSIWVADPGLNLLVELRPPYVYFSYMSLLFR